MIDWLSHIWEPSLSIAFSGHMSNDRVIYFLQKIQQLIIQQRRIVSCLQLLRRCKKWPHAQQPQTKEQHYTTESEGDKWLSPSGCGYIAFFLMICVHAIIGYSWLQLLVGQSSSMKICGFQSSVWTRLKMEENGYCIWSKHRRVAMEIVTGHTPEHCHIS